MASCLVGEIRRARKERYLSARPELGITTVVSGGISHFVRMK
jgi:hypothetical protein